MMDVEQFLDQPRLGFFIDGEFCTAPEREDMPLISPLTRNAWKRLVPASKHDVERAILAAQTAFSSWRSLPSPSRSAYLRNIGDLIEEYHSQFAKIMAIEMGKPISQGYAEAFYAAGYFYWFAGEAERIYGQIIPSQSENKKLCISYEPIGVCAAITPWNFPLAMAARKIAAALGAGCTILNKPSPESPVTMLLLAQLCKMAKLPKGVLNIVPGPENGIGEALLNSPLVRKLSFTGSTRVGQYLYERSGATLKKLTLELGGNAPLLVFEDADIKHAVSQTLTAKFRNNGQSCIACNRIFVHESIYEDYTALLIEETKKLNIGDPMEISSDLSHILHPASVERIQIHIQNAIDNGAIAEYIGGTAPYYPCLLIDATPQMLVCREETFGPTVPLIRFKTDEEVLEMANDTPFGLAAYVFTDNLNRAAKIVDGLECGIIGLNDGLPSAPQSSFGGVKFSGFGREGGPTGLREYLVEKFISTRFH